MAGPNLHASSNGESAIALERNPRGRSGRKAGWILLGLTILLVVLELRTSFFQAHALSFAAHRMTFEVAPGAVPRGGGLILASPGPYDERLGYSLLPEAEGRLARAGYVQTNHTELSTFNHAAVLLRLPPIYDEKIRTGLRLVGEQGMPLYEATIPREVYPNYSAIAPLIAQTLLYAENRQILEESLPYRNPTIEWERLSRAVLDFAINKLDRAHPVTGASTVATQLEKLRHSPGGRTLTGGDKFRQMLASSLRAYQNGAQNLDARRQIVCDYINSLPLAATPSAGEVIGLADGLRAWFGVDPYRVNQLLRMSDDEAQASGAMEARAKAYREAVTLLLAAKRPSGFLIDNREALSRRVDTYLVLLERERIISSALRDAALAVRPVFRDTSREKPRDVIHEIPAQTDNGEPVIVPAPQDRMFAERKGIDSVRIALLGLTGAESLYALDRLDLTASTTLDRQATIGVARILQSLSQPEAAGRAGLFGKSLLSSDNAGGVIYSFTLYEKQDHVGHSANVLRVQADNYPQPLNINQGTMLELGSTAKLRTLANYLTIVSDLHAKLSPLTTEQLENYPCEKDDAITAWAADYLSKTKDRGLAAMLEAAMSRKYSGNTGEAFFTGGGVHNFANFDGSDSGRIMEVRDAFHHSVNLVFIRLMHDIVRYHLALHPEKLAILRTDAYDPRRREYVAKFADFEGGHFLEQFYRRYSAHPEKALDLAIATSNRGVSNKLSPGRFSVIYRTLRPEDDFAAFAAAAEHYGVVFKPNKEKDDEAQEREAIRLYREFAPQPSKTPGQPPSPGSFNWNDLGYLAKVHPLELWTAMYLPRHPNASLDEIMTASTQARQEAYSWLFRPHLRREQNNRIWTLLEREAFVEIHKDWARLGFPFQELVPSLATAIGSSGDTPDALATLAGIILNDGVRNPSVRIPKLHFAAGTPYETTFERDLSPGERVMPSEVASVLHHEMIGVVEQGTAIGALNSVKLSGGRVIPIGGKTGTGDNRIEHYASNGAVIESKVRNRTAAFVFTIGDHFFGTMVVYAEGSSAASKSFTSALAVQVFRNLAPELRPLIEHAYPKQ